MTSLTRFAIALTPFIVFGACSETNDGKHQGGPHETGGDAGAGGEAGDRGGGGSAGTATGKGGRNTGGTGGDAGDAGGGGEITSGTGGNSTGGSPGTGGSGGLGGDAGPAGAAGESGDAGQSGSAGTGGGTCTTVAVPLRGGDFDSDTAQWISYDDGIGPASVLIVSAASQNITADTAPNVAHLGGANGNYAGMYQSITIPAGAVTLTLTGRRLIKTAEGSTRLDEMAIQLWGDAMTETGFIGEFASLGNDNPSDDWLPVIATVPVEEYAGQAVDLDIWAETDVSLVTDFYLDSLVVTAEVCR